MGRGGGRPRASSVERLHPEEVEVVIAGIGSEGEGVGRLPDGRVLFVHRAAPGDRARVAILRSAPRWARGRLVSLDAEGPGRRPAPCTHYAGCGGCTLQHVEYQEQLAAKERILIEALRRIGKRTDLPAPRIHAAPAEFHYRNRLTFTLRREAGGAVRAGFHRVGAPDGLLDVADGCLLPEVPLAAAWSELRGAWGAGADLLPTGAELRLTLRATADGAVLLLVSGGTGVGDPSRLLAAAPRLSAIWVQDLSGKVRLAAGDASVEEEWLGDRFPLPPTAFLQVNRAMAGILFEGVLRGLGDLRGLRFVDAYCGIAGYGRWAARGGAQSTGIESDPGAAEEGRARPQEGFTLLEGKVEERLHEALPADVVLLNPPRAGVGEGVMEALALAVPRRIIYASCDPATLARDLLRLGPAYQISSIELFDLFPQTAHLEAVLTLNRE